MKKTNTMPIIEKETVIEKPSKKGCSISINGILWFIILCALCGASVKTCQVSKVRLEQEKYKLQQMKDGTYVREPVVKSDTLKNFFRQQGNVLLLNQNQKQR